MKNYLIATLITVGLATSAFAAPAAQSQHFAVMDTVGNCAVVDSLPSTASGLKILGDKTGYSKQAEAQKILGPSCKSVIDRA